MILYSKNSFISCADLEGGTGDPDHTLEIHEVIGPPMVALFVYCI